MAVGTSIDDNINLDEVELIPSGQMELEDLTRAVSGNTLVQQRMLAKLKNLDAGFNSMLEGSNLNFVWREFTPELLYKLPGDLTGIEFVDVTASGIYGLAELDSTNTVLWMKGSIQCTGAPSYTEDAADWLEPDAYCFIPTPVPTNSTTFDVVGNLTANKVQLTAATPTIFYGFVPAIDGAVLDAEDRSLLQLLATYDGSTIGLFPSGFASGSAIHFDCIFQVNTELELVAIPPPPTPPMEGLIAWYDLADQDTLFTDTAWTTPVTADGQTVRSIHDKSGNANHLTSSVAGVSWVSEWNDEGYLRCVATIAFNKQDMVGAAGQTVITKLSAWANVSGTSTGGLNSDTNTNDIYIGSLSNFTQVCAPTDNQYIFSTFGFLTSGIVMVKVERVDLTQALAARASLRLDNTTYLVTSSPASTLAAFPAANIEIREVGRNSTFNSSGNWYESLMYAGDSVDIEAAIEYLRYKLGANILPQALPSFADSAYAFSGGSATLSGTESSIGTQQLLMTFKYASTTTFTTDKTFSFVASDTISNATFIGGGCSLRTLYPGDVDPDVGLTIAGGFGWSVKLFECAGFHRAGQATSSAETTGASVFTIPGITAEQDGMVIRVFNAIADGAITTTGLTAVGFTTIYTAADETSQDTTPPIVHGKSHWVVLAKMVTAGEVVPSCVLTYSAGVNGTGYGALLC
jgi:hypothetical protein